MRKMLTLFIFMILVSSVSVQAYPGIIQVDSVSAYAGESFGVKVWLRGNNIDISAMSLPLKFNNPYLSLDSVSTVGSVWDANFASYLAIDNSNQTVRITMLPSEVVNPLPSVNFVDGVVAELFFTLSNNALPSTTKVDSIYSDTTIAGGIHIITRIDVSDNSGNTVYMPSFDPGTIVALVPTATEDDGSSLALPGDFTLSQNYPNPFNPSTMISFALPTASHARLDIFNILGQDVATLVDRQMEAGWHQVELDGSSLPSGIYFYRLTYDQGALTRKMILLK